MLVQNRYALKEWATICDGLGRAEFILLVRKGGILEHRDGFEVEHSEFFLFPTRFHEKGETPSSQVTLEFYADVEEDQWVKDLEALRRLNGHHGLPWSDVEQRFHYGKEKGVHVLAIRAYRLVRPYVLADARTYDGCRSWVELDSEYPVERGVPVVDADEFRHRLESFRAVLHG